MKFVKLSILIIICTLLFSCKNNENGVALKGDISSLENPQVLVSYFAGDTLAIDTIMSDKRGRFTYKNTIDTLTVFSLYFNNQSSSVMVFAHPKDNISIKGDAQLSDLIKVNGNEINNDLTLFKESNKELLQQRTLLLRNLKEEKESNSASNNRILANADEIAKINSFNQELTLNAEEQVKKNPTKISSLILINEFFANSENPKGLSRVLEYMQGDILKSKMGLNLKAYSEKINRSAEGSSMPYFRLVDKSATPYNRTITGENTSCCLSSQLQESIPAKRFNHSSKPTGMLTKTAWSSFPYISIPIFIPSVILKTILSRGPLYRRKKAGHQTSWKHTILSSFRIISLFPLPASSATETSRPSQWKMHLKIL